MRDKQERRQIFTCQYQQQQGTCDEFLSPLSNNTPSTLSSPSHLIYILSILVNQFGSRDGDDLFRGDALSHLYSIVSIQHGIPPESQITLYDELHMFIDTVMSSILLPHIYFSLIPEEYERFNDADSAITSVVYLESLNPSIYHCFNLIDHGIQPSNLLHENKEMKHFHYI